MAYATIDDIEEFFEDDPMPAHSDRLLELAADRVNEMLVGYVWNDLTDEVLPAQTNADGSPRTVADVLKRVTCLQFQYMADLGDETGSREGYTSMSTGSVSWSKSTGRGGQSTVSRYSPNAVSALRLGGIRFGVYAG